MIGVAGKGPSSMSWDRNYMLCSKEIDCEMQVYVSESIRLVLVPCPWTITMMSTVAISGWGPECLLNLHHVAHHTDEQTSTLDICIVYQLVWSRHLTRDIRNYERDELITYMSHLSYNTMRNLLFIKYIRVSSSALKERTISILIRVLVCSCMSFFTTLQNQHISSHSLSCLAAHARLKG